MLYLRAGLPDSRRLLRQEEGRGYGTVDGWLWYRRLPLPLPHTGMTEVQGPREAR